jgi:hypothetical protein
LDEGYSAAMLRATAVIGVVGAKRKGVAERERDEDEAEGWMSISGREVLELNRAFFCVTRHSISLALHAQCY